MSEAILFGIAKSILQVLGSPALDEFRLLWGQKKELKKLEDTITTISDVLHDADRKQASDDTVRGWVTRLRIVLYEADDLFDSISAKLLHDKVNTGSKIPKEVHRFLSKPRHYVMFVKTAHKVKEIRERIDAIKSDIQGFNFLPIRSEPYRINKETTHSYVPNGEVVGREKEREDIVEMLLPERLHEPTGDVPIVVVIGIGGLGKTTLAQLIFNDRRVQQGFELCMWVCLNYLSPLEQVLVVLMKSATKSEVNQFDLDTLQSKFRKVIEGKKVLLVLDDVWDEDPQNWRKLKVLLNSGKHGSMVLATTRSETVAKSLNATKPYYRLQGMSDDSAWLLFKKIAFPREEESHGQEMEESGRQIVRKCAHLPLAIVTIASLLRDKEKEKWIPFVNDELSKVVPEEHSKIMQILKISYNEFPYHVKSCFAYCSLFPKDYEFEKQNLVRLWIAQGFVESLNRNESLEDIAERYFMHLVERCFFQDMELFVSNGVGRSTCRMHDLVHDLAIEVSKLEIVLVDKPTQILSHNTIRHVCLYDDGNSSMDNVYSFPHATSVRTFIHLSGYRIKNTSLIKLISCFNVLRVLDLSSLSITEIPSSIGNLIHLRFLDLANNNIERLPSSICNLQHLKYIILQDCNMLKELPKDIGKLLSLRHLVLQGCDGLFQMPYGMTALTSLVSLDKLIIHYPGDGLKNFGWFENSIKNLEIEVCVERFKDVVVDAQKLRLSRNRRLVALTINFKIEDEFFEAGRLMDALQPHDNLEILRIKGFRGKELSAWVMCLRNLVTLHLISCRGCVEMPPLSRLRSLKKLYLSDMPSMLTIEGNLLYDPHESFFPSLEIVFIHGMPNLRSWWLQSPTLLPTFPRVIEVEIRDCPKLTACMPLFPLVETLKLKNVGGEFLKWLGNGNEEIGHPFHNGSSRRYFSSLQKLRIDFCEELEISWRGLAYLTSLEQLSISGCPKLRWIDGSNDEMLEETLWGHLSLSKIWYLKIQNVNGLFFKGLRYVTCLRYLIIHSFNFNLNEVKENVSINTEEQDDAIPWKALRKLEALDLEFGERLPLKGLENLTSIQYLRLRNCKELHMSWRALLSLNHLQKLWIEDVEKVNEVDFVSSSSSSLTSIIAPQIQLTSSSLKYLEIKDGSGQWLADIPWKSFATLKTLYLIDISDMEALPNGIQHLHALEYLGLGGCKRVVSLPSWMSSLSSLRMLCIWRCCRELKKRCERGIGEDWPLIRHIPGLRVSAENVIPLPSMQLC